MPNHNHRASETVNPWPFGTAGHEMVKAIPVIPKNVSVLGTKAILTEKINHYESIDYIYVVNDDNTLHSVISIKELYRHEPHTHLADIRMTQELFTVEPQDQRELAAHQALKEGIHAIPVVEKDGTFLGVITHSNIIKIIHAEQRGQILHLSGIHHTNSSLDNPLDISAWSSILHRIPWLLIGLAGGLVAAKIISGFEATLEKNLILAAFIPLVVYIADAVGTQLEAFTIRDFALFRKLNFVRYIVRQVVIVSVIALIIGIAITLASLMIYGDVTISIVLGLAIVSASMSSLFSGLIIPYIFRRINLDPANASGPIGTIIQDILSVLIYFLIATILL